MAPIEPDLKEDFLKKFGFGEFFKRIFVYIFPKMAPLHSVVFDLKNSTFTIHGYLGLFHSKIGVFEYPCVL